MALTAAHNLGKNGCDVIGCDDVDLTVLKFSKHTSNYFTHASFDKDIDAYLDDMEHYIKKYKPDDDRPYILMPMFRDAKILAQHRKRFKDLITITAPDINSINQVTPKDNLVKTCEKLNVTAPKTVIIEDDNQLDSIGDKFDFPVLIKPTTGRGGRGIHIIKDQDELKSRYQNHKEKYDTFPLIQELVDGEDYCLCVLCDNGKIVAHMAYKNLHTFPRDSGAGIMRQTVDDKFFLDTATKLLKGLNWHGVAELDFKWNEQKDSPAYLIEVNSRFWAGLFHSVESGVNFPWLTYQLFADGKVTDNVNVDIGKKTKIPGLLTLASAQEFFDQEDSFKNLQTSWSALWSNKNNEKAQTRMTNFAKSFRNLLDAPLLENYDKITQDDDDVISELSLGDDPMTTLGILFIVSSLLKHGELPPELKS